MEKVIVFGNSGSGKSTLANELVDKQNLSHLDLDTLAWEDTKPPSRKPLDESQSLIEAFLVDNDNWVIEGGYTDLLALVVDRASKIIFLNLDVDMCIKNCIQRPWEPHKYESEDKQNENLEMLIGWVKEYSTRNDCFSLSAHEKLFKEYLGTKVEYTSNSRDI